jgi:hypothetical protein
MTEQERRWRAELEGHGYERIRDDMASGGHRLIGGPPEKRRFARDWLKKKETKEAAADYNFRLLSLWIGLAALLVAIVAVVIAWAAWK